MIPADSEVIHIICEGHECNPTLSEYDRYSSQYGAFGGDKFARDLLRDLRKALKHTPHKLHTGERFVVGRGWVRRWCCQVCGHVRMF